MARCEAGQRREARRARRSHDSHDGEPRARRLLPPRHSVVPIVPPSCPSCFQRLKRGHAERPRSASTGSPGPFSHLAPRPSYLSLMPSAADFFAIDLRVGTVLRAEPFPEARVPAIKLWIDFGPELGERRTSAQLTRRYDPASLVGRQVVGVVNIGTRRVAGFESEVLVLGGIPEAGDVVLLLPGEPVPNGTRIG